MEVGGQGEYKALAIAVRRRKQVRAVLCCYDPVAGNSRHLNEFNFPSREPLDNVDPRHKWVHDFKRRLIDVNALLIGIVVSPWASDEVFEEVKLWAKVKNFSCPVNLSSLKGSLTPTVEELKKYA